jgi:hypothetical protein
MSSIHRDERTVVVENASYRWGYRFVSFGVLVLVMYRSLALDQSIWDLFALLILGSAVPTAYQWYHRVLTVEWAKTQIIAMVAAAIVAMLVVLARACR